MKYIVVCNTSMDGLSVAVENLLASGYICQGGVSVSSPSRDHCAAFYQAMIKPE